MSTFQIRLFGKISLRQDGQPLHDLPAKALELLCYLLLHRYRAHTRESLSETLWPGASFTQSKKYLRQTLWQLQAELDEPNEYERPVQSNAVESLISLDPGWVGINPNANCWLDVDVLEQAYDQCRETPDWALTHAQAHALEAAIALYEGDLIETWYQDWCIYERERLQLMYLALLEKLMGYCEAHQLYAKGLAYGQRILRHDPAHESTHRHLMRLYCKAGDRTTALRQFERCKTALSKEFGLPPCRETNALDMQIRAECLGEVPAVVLEQSPLGPPASTGQAEGDLKQRLGYIQAHLTALQGQVQQGLALVGQILTAASADGFPQTAQQTPRQTD